MISFAGLSNRKVREEGAKAFTPYALSFFVLFAPLGWDKSLIMK